MLRINIEKQSESSDIIGQAIEDSIQTVHTIANNPFDKAFRFVGSEGSGPTLPANKRKAAFFNPVVVDAAGLISCSMYFLLFLFFI